MDRHDFAKSIARRTNDPSVSFSQYLTHIPTPNFDQAPLTHARIRGNITYLPRQAENDERLLIESAPLGLRDHKSMGKTKARDMAEEGEGEVGVASAACSPPGLTFHPERRRINVDRQVAPDSVTLGVSEGGGGRALVYDPPRED